MDSDNRMAAWAGAVCRVETSEFKSWFAPILLKQLAALAPAAKKMQQ